MEEFLAIPKERQVDMLNTILLTGCLHYIVDSKLATEDELVGHLICLPTPPDELVEYHAKAELVKALIPEMINHVASQYSFRKE
jgi:hypothetical protein